MMSEKENKIEKVESLYNTLTRGLNSQDSLHILFGHFVWTQWV